MSKRSGTTWSIRSGFPDWQPWSEFLPSRCPRLSQRRQPALIGFAYAVAAARIADALTQDVLLAPLEAGVIPLPHQLHALTRAVTASLRALFVLKPLLFSVLVPPSPRWGHR